MTVVEIAAVAAILGLGATLQSAVGFGMPLFAVPLLVLAGQPLPTSVALALGAALVQTAYGSWMTRELIRWRFAFSLAAIAWVTQFAGVACMALLVQTDGSRVKQAVGVAVLAAVTAQWLLRPEPRERLAPGWAAAAASSAGFLGGLVGIGGPPLVLFGMAHDWSPDRFRAFMWSQFLLSLPVLTTALALRFGSEILLRFGLGVAMAPAIWLGTRLGRALTARWERPRLQLAATLVLYAIGLTSLLGPLLGD